MASNESQSTSRITVHIANTEPHNSLKVQYDMPCIVSEDNVSYDLTFLVAKTMEVYQLDPSKGIQIDYWSCQMQTFILVEDFFGYCKKPTI